MAAETLPIVDLRGLAATAENADAFGANAAFHSRPLPEQQAVAINSAHRGYMGMATSLIVTSSVEEATKPNLSESFILMHEVLPGEERGLWTARTSGRPRRMGSRRRSPPTMLPCVGLGST